MFSDCLIDFFAGFISFWCISSLVFSAVQGMESSKLLELYVFILVKILFKELNIKKFAKTKVNLVIVSLGLYMSKIQIQSLHCFCQHVSKKWFTQVSQFIVSMMCITKSSDYLVTWHFVWSRFYQRNRLVRHEKFSPIKPKKNHIYLYTYFY